jgi:hypothetical protein
MRDWHLRQEIPSACCQVTLLFTLILEVTSWALAVECSHGVITVRSWLDVAARRVAQGWRQRLLIAVINFHLSFLNFRLSFKIRPARSSWTSRARRPPDLVPCVSYLSKRKTSAFAFVCRKCGTPLQYLDNKHNQAAKWKEERFRGENTSCTRTRTLLILSRSHPACCKRVSQICRSDSSSRVSLHLARRNP